MQSSAAELFHTWHDFYILVGTASATLTGLMFVAASIGSSVFSEQNRNALQAFFSPTVVNFAAVLFICIAVMIPSQTWLSLGLLLAGGGVAGLIYAGRVWFHMIVRRAFHVDCCWFTRRGVRRSRRRPSSCCCSPRFATPGT
jgi:hypothetical protein